MRYSGFGRTGLFVVAASVGVAGLAATAEAAPRPAYSSSKFTQDEVSQTGADQTTGLISDRISDVTGDNNNGGTASLDSGTNKAAGSAEHAERRAAFGGTVGIGDIRIQCRDAAGRQAFDHAAQHQDP